MFFTAYKLYYVTHCKVVDKVLDINKLGTSPRRRRAVQALRNVNSYLLHEVQNHDTFLSWWHTLTTEYQNVAATNSKELEKVFQEKLAEIAAQQHTR